MHLARPWGAIARSCALATLFSVVASAAPQIYSFSTASGRVAYDFNYSITSSSATSYGATGLPPGLTLDASRGAITGRPTQAGTYPVTVSATDSTGTATKDVTFTIDPAPTEPPVITVPTTTFESHNHFYYHADYDVLAIPATNYPQSMTATGSPGDPYFNGMFGEGLHIDYTTTVPGIYHVTVTATNPVGTSTAHFDWFVHAAIMAHDFSRPTYTGGETIVITIQFDVPVAVTGSPRIPLPGEWADGQPHFATYASGSGTRNLTFQYQTRPDDFQPNDHYYGAIDLNGGSIKDPTTGLDAYIGYNTQRISGALTYHVMPPPGIATAASASGTVGEGFRLTVTGSNQVNRFEADNLPPGLALSPPSGAMTTEISGVPTLSGTFNVALRAWNPYGLTPATAALTITILDSPTGRPTIARQPTTAAAAQGASVSFTTATTSASPTYQWQWNGRQLDGASAASYTVSNVSPANVGLYTAVITAGGQSTLTTPAILGLLATTKVAGSGSEVGPNIVHPNGNVYDQVLLQGAAATVTADYRQVVRTSFLDLNDDIVQVEFSGKGTLTIVLDSPSGPMVASNYNQPDVTYMKGHAGIVVTGADDTTNLSVFSVGRVTAVNQNLFRSDVHYDGVADIAFIAVQSDVGKMAAIRAANTSFWSTRGITGLYAPGVTFSGPVRLCDIIATEDATPVILTGQAAEVEIAGGDLNQTNGRAVQVKGFPRLHFVAGATSNDDSLPALANRARLEEDGVDVTSQIVVNP